MFLAVVALTTCWWSGLACILDRKECFTALTFRQQSVGQGMFPDVAFQFVHDLMASFFAAQIIEW